MSPLVFLLLYHHIFFHLAAEKQESCLNYMTIQINYRNVHRLDVSKFNREEHIIGLRVYIHVYWMHLIEQLTMMCLYSTVYQIKVFALIRN